MSPIVETSTPPNTPKPIGPYNHIAKVGSFISIGGTAGANPATGQLAGADIASQTKQILDSFQVMLESVNSDLNHVVHINIFLKNMSDFDEMNRIYSSYFPEGKYPARTTVVVAGLPHPDFLLEIECEAVLE